MTRSAALVCMMLIGCSGTEEPVGADAAVNVDSSNELDGGDALSSDASEVGGPIALACPGLLPREGAACVGALNCSYAGCDPMKPDGASCVAGKWHIVAAACSTPDGRCPATRPVLGTACAGSRDELCLYTACGRDELAYCDGGKWSGKYGGCADTSHCPPTIPAVGEACTGAGSTCMYTNTCGIATGRTCVDGKWSGPPVAPCETLAPCPTTQPANGDACTPPAEFTMCVWKNSCGGVDYGACGWITGKATAWTIIRPACPATTCPTTPDDGAACTGTETCVYPLGGDCSLSCTCTSAKWVCTRSTCSRG